MGVQLSSSPFASSPAAVWAAAFDAVGERIGPVFARSETREQAQAYLRGLLSPIKRKRGHAPKARHPARKRVILVAGRSLGEDGSHFHAGELVAKDVPWCLDEPPIVAPNGST